jgi:hypothetical protein
MPRSLLACAVASRGPWREKGLKNDKRKRMRGKKALERWYNLWKNYTVHPGLRINYFQTIDTREKAYWL